MNVSKLQTILGSVNKEVARSAKAATESFKVELEMATIAAQSIKDKNSPEYKAAVQTLNDVKGRQKSLYELMVRDLLSQRSDILKRLGGTGGGGSKNLSAADKIAGVVK